MFVLLLSSCVPVFKQTDGNRRKEAKGGLSLQQTKPIVGSSPRRRFDGMLRRSARLAACGKADSGLALGDPHGGVLKVALPHFAAMFYLGTPLGASLRWDSCPPPLRWLPPKFQSDVGCSFCHSFE